VAHRFVSSCPNCGKQFAILWVMNSTRRVDPETVARLACPLCGKRFCQMPKAFRKSGLRYRTSSLVVPCGAWK
jgi:predicted RNA-binding Zn-ribbon protein involved in translation (DUF1610 family)